MLVMSWVKGWTAIQAAARRIKFGFGGEFWILLWAAAFLGGVALFLSVPVPCMVIGFLALLSVLLWTRKKVVVRRLGVAGLIVLMGIMIAWVHSSSKWRPAIAAPLVAQLEGRVVDLAPRADGSVRLRLSDVKMAQNKSLRGVQLTIRTAVPETISAGAHIAIRARLLPPPGPVLPGGYNFARRAYFENIDAVGFAVSDVTLIDTTKASWLGILRQSVFTRLSEHLDGDQLGLAAAMLIGRRGLLTKEAEDTMRRAGLAHLLAISGLHMGLVAGLVLLVIEYGLAAIPVFGRSYIARPYALIAALIGLTLYYLLSGQAVSATRAYYMGVIILFAGLMGRPVFSLRSLALAAIFIAAFNPVAVLSPGFQMSFCATLALILVFSPTARIDDAMNEPSAPKDHGNGLWKILKMAFYVTAISQIAVLPAALAHFGAISVVGAVANLVVTPFVALVAMPLLVLSALLMSVGLHAVTLSLAGLAMDVILVAAQWGAGLPLATLFFPSLPDGWSLALGAAVLWALAVQSGPYWVRFTPAAMVMMAIALLPRAEQVIIVDNDPLKIMAWQPGEPVYYRGLRPGGFVGDSWTRSIGLDAKDSSFIRLQKRCDGAGCTYSNGERIFLAKSQSALENMTDCNRAIIAITVAPVANCAALQINQQELRDKGPLVIRYEHGKATKHYAVTDTNQRPWDIWLKPK